MSLVSKLVRSALRRKQRGGVAIMVAIAFIAVFAMAGMGIDAGRLYVNKSELQTAADACALAAAGELTCDPVGGAVCPASFLQIAQSAGQYAASRNKRDFQTNSVAIAAADVKFYTALAPNANYLSIAGGASRNSKYVMCTAESTGILPWFMGAVGAGAQAVRATAVATRAPGESVCPTAPIGVCTVAGAPAPHYGYGPDEWIAGSFTNAGGGEGISASTDCNPAVYPGCSAGGSFRWIDYTPSAGGTNEVCELLNGTISTCGVSVGGSVKEEGAKQGAKAAYNGRFGIYPPGGGTCAASLTGNPPDRTGYSYPSKAPPGGGGGGGGGGGPPVVPVIGIGNPGAYDDYRSRQGNFTGFVTNEYNDSNPTTVPPTPPAIATGGAGGNVNAASSATPDERRQYGQDRRLFAAPFISCGGGGATTTIQGMGCFLMLNPMSNGANGTIYLQYRGLANAAGSPCRTSGATGGAVSTGPQVPTLVQ